MKEIITKNHLDLIQNDQASELIKNLFETDEILKKWVDKNPVLFNLLLIWVQRKDDIVGRLNDRETIEDVVNTIINNEFNKDRGGDVKNIGYWSIINYIKNGHI